MKSLSRFVNNKLLFLLIFINGFLPSAAHAAEKVSIAAPSTIETGLCTAARINVESSAFINHRVILKSTNSALKFYSDTKCKNRISTTPVLKTKKIFILASKETSYTLTVTAPWLKKGTSKVRAIYQIGLGGIEIELPEQTASGSCFSATLHLLDAKNRRGFKTHKKLTANLTGSQFVAATSSNCQTGVTRSFQFANASAAKKIFLRFDEVGTNEISATLTPTNFSSTAITFVTPEDQDRYKLDLGQVSQFGIFDPSLAVDSHAAWMSYSAINHTSTGWLYPNQLIVSTRLAKSENFANNWVDVGLQLNSPRAVLLNMPGYPNRGVWHNEVSTLVYDAYATEAERWRLIWHHYLTMRTADKSIERRFEHGWLAYKAAATVDGLPLAEEVKLFTGNLYRDVNDIADGPSGSPLGGAPFIALSSRETALQNCKTFSEPGLLVTSTQLYLSLLCVDNPSAYDERMDPAQTVNRIILLSCDQPCDMQNTSTNWVYLGDLLTDKNAPSANLKFSAPNLMIFDGQIYLTVTITGGDEDHYQGCKTYRVSDLKKAELDFSHPMRDIMGTPGSFNGACASHEKVNSGRVYYSELDLTKTDFFRIFFSGMSFFTP